MYWITKIAVAVAAILLLPVFFLIGAALAVSSGLPVFFRQRRTGLGGKPFLLYKFRTMVADAERRKKELAPLNEAAGPVFKIRNDPRFTPIGRFLSHSGLDELPQLINVLKGEMALIGPRPLPVDEAKKLTSWMKKRQDIAPGIISPWILEGHNHGDFAAWMKSDIAYVSQKSLWYDIILSVRTLRFLLTLLMRELVALGSGK